MDIFEQQELYKNRPKVTSKLNNWHDWLVNHVPITIKDRASRAFKAFKDKVIEDQILKPYQLKQKKKRGKETFIEQKELPPPEPKKLKRMKKKLNDLNSKIRHSQKKNDGLIHKGNSLRRAIEEIKQANRRQPTIELAQGFVECEQAFRGTYRSYRVNGRTRMDVENFFHRIKRDLIELIKRELTDLNSAR